MLEEYILVAHRKKEFDEQVKEYFVNMEKNVRTLHKTGKCYWANYAYKFITFSSLDEVKEFEKTHRNATPFKRCGNCFR